MPPIPQPAGTASPWGEPPRALVVRLDRRDHATVRLNQLLYLLARTLASVAAVLIAVSLVDLLSDGLQRRADRTETKMDDQLIPLLRRSAKLLVVVIGTLFVLQNLSVDVSSLLGSLAIGGLAFSLAAKDTVANLFGSVTIFTDRPFQIGDWVLIDGVEGVVEEVGFRSTRLRTFADSIVALLKSVESQSPLANVLVLPFSDNGDGSTSAKIEKLRCA